MKEYLKNSNNSSKIYLMKLQKSIEGVKKCMIELEESKVSWAPLIAEAEEFIEFID